MHILHAVLDPAVSDAVPILHEGAAHLGGQGCALQAGLD